MKKLKLNYFILLLSIAASLPLFAQTTGRISGVVVDSVNGTPLAGAVVKIAGINMGAFTEDDGKFVLPDLAPGTYTLIAAYVGYEQKKISDIHVFADKRTKINFRLAMDPGVRIDTIKDYLK